MSFASMFTDGPTSRPKPVSAHTFETDEPEAAPAVAPKKKAQADVFVDVDGLQVPDTKTVNRWASAIENRYPVEVRQITSVGHPTNTYGCWVFEKFKLSALGDRKEGKHERLRYADALQMQEIYAALGESERFWRLVSGYDEHGNSLPGPTRKDKPPVDAKGLPIEEQPSRGEHGPLPKECAWIEAHDNTFIEYLGTDPQWPNGCWQVEKSGCVTQYLDLNGIKYVAHTILGMPHSAAWDGKMGARDRKRLMKAQTNGGGFASLFAEEEAQVEAPQSAASFVSLFA